MVKVKICGLTNVKDASRACDYGADLLGFIFVKGTPRYVENIRDIISDLPPEVKNKTGRVGLFKDEELEEVARTVAGCDLDYVQLHGEERPDYCRALKNILRDRHNLSAKIIKTFKIRDRILPQGQYSPCDYEQADYFVFDTFHPEISGGTGRRFDWQVLIKERERIKKPFFIAGGLTPENVASAVKTVRPYGVDVSSGVEDLPGEKDENLLKEFIENAKKAQTAR
ncbi:MAG: N-(5'-phosphoribosyl)anthranilate isomerase [Candidatus Makaraimicrobium thalassicum]|nr:MAG: N-(5'-phosphoribosyl)anthranilate isomerase [Candidatus Omnitrophota bacterium]